jgi:hypothetical protein
MSDPQCRYKAKNNKHRKNQDDQRQCNKIVKFSRRSVSSSGRQILRLTWKTFYTKQTIKPIDYIGFYVTFKNFLLIWRRHHYRWRAAKFSPMLGARSLIFENHTHSYVSVENPDPIIYTCIHIVAAFSKLEDEYSNDKFTTHRYNGMLNYLSIDINCIPLIYLTCQKDDPCQRYVCVY